ncbi:hypothetical protein BD779DRAFT_1675946 [Infundibulicybe gibba]|nr:hypothetical protein BD779DRAFT_1675946 [Infundibulicybe gibba]
MPCSNCHCPSCLAFIGSPTPSTEFLPPPTELMTTNRAPTSPEVAYSRSIIYSAENAISLIQKTVQKRKSELLGLINAHKAVISPLRSFPPELLAEIFARFVGMMDYDLTPVPLMLMGVCSQWRKIVLGIPRLWTKILTSHPMIDSWISRSKALPLYLDLDLSRDNSRPVVEALIPHSHRWEQVNFGLSSSSNSILSRTRTRLDSLKQLTLHFRDTSGTVDFCEVAPQLTEIDLTGIYKRIVIKLPWEQLRVCTLDNAEITHYALRHAKNLRVLHLSIDYKAPRLMSMPRNPHSCHSGLSTLNMWWNYSAHEVSFFSSITLPSLQTLKIRFTPLDPEMDQDNIRYVNIETDRAEAAPILAGFFRRSCAHLSTLTLDHIPFSQSELIECLALAPSLVSLDIQFDGHYHTTHTMINEKLLCRLNANHPKSILPRLRSLSLRGPGMFSEELLYSLIASRQDIDRKNDGVALLENLTLECPFGQPGLSDTWSPRFQQFVSGGLNITYRESMSYNCIF